MKKSLFALIASALIISSVSAGDYEKNNYNPGYKTAIIDDSLQFEAGREGYEVELSWDVYKGDDFKYYKVMRSTKVENPIYPEQPAIGVLDDKNKDKFYLKNWDANSAYYRVCVIRTDNARTCSNVVKLKGFDKAEKKKDKKMTNHTSKEKYQNKKNVKKSNLDLKLAVRADKMIENLVTRLEKKYGNDTEKKAERLESIIKKLETLNDKIKSEQTKSLISYISEGIEKALNKMGVNDDIEKIFNILEEEK